MTKTQRGLCALMAALLMASLAACSPNAAPAPTATPAEVVETGVPAATDAPEATAAPEAAEAATTPDDVSAATAKSDFFRYINKDWLTNTQIPADKMTIGGFADLQDELTLNLKKLFDDGLAAGDDKKKDDIGKMLSFYGIAKDYEQRDAQGMEPIRAVYDEIAAVKDVAGLEKLLTENQLLLSPFVSYSISPDLKDSTKYVLYFSPASVTLGEKSYYDETTEHGKTSLPVLQAGYASMFQLAGQTAEEAAALAQQAIDMEKLLAQAQPTAEEKSVVEKQYNVLDFAAFDESTAYDLEALLKKIECPVPETVVVTSPAFFEALSGIMTEENLPKMRAYAQAQLVTGSSSYLSTEFLNALLTINQQLMGTTASKPLDEYAFNLANSLFMFPAGDLYVQNYFSEAARADVTDMVKDMIGTYKKRLTALDWMSEATKAKALEKLDTMKLKIGYPDTYRNPLKDYAPKGYADGGSLMGNILDASACAQKYQVSLLGTKVDKSEWNAPPSMVNAFYSPTSNEITFPAGILQPPFYDANRSRSENLGAIGSIIAHEISHAFDNNGAKFDKDGNMTDWWTAEDYAAFEGLTQALVKQFDAATFAGQKINGTLTLSENIADLGGMGCALETAQALPDFDAEKFFAAYATQWRMKSTAQYEQMLLQMDNHAPNEARVNVILPNFDVFLQTYGIAEGDAMYRSEADRVRIW